VAESSHNRPSDHIAELKERATEQFGQAADQAQRMVERVVAQGREAGESAQEVAGNVRGALDRSIKDKPIATLATAAIAGFVLGALWKS
jgi:ElaB/YqjD/DUF883 family membrane-anchored ribosome-binding protein